ncbi:MAG: TIGR03808 family TAT-translocated repetitive protein [Hyphomicrobium sp.]|nr:TIGR03808 family TAT-translocated repetitive protein [Hyphomicrobium sp.]
MLTSRRNLVAAGIGMTVASAASAAVAGSASAAGARRPQNLKEAGLQATGRGLHFQSVPGDPDQKRALQEALDAAARAGVPLLLPAGVIRTGTLNLPSGSVLVGAAGLTTLECAAGAAVLMAENAEGLVIRDLVVDGRHSPLGSGEEDGLIRLSLCRGLTIENVTVRRSLANGIVLQGCSGRVAATTVEDVLLAGLRSLDAKGLQISGCRIADCGNNGIQIWRNDAGDDGALVTDCRIERVAANGGGTGENGNGISVFRAGGVVVQGNRITDCAYSAIRGNAASNLTMVGNSCQRLGEVALYAEFGFEGAVIANNVIDGAATGISVTNMDHGGRLAVVEGNVIRNLFRREQEPVDVRGDGITIEADSVVSGNAIDGAPTSGIRIGWGPYLRNVVVSGNMLRDTGAGIVVSSDDRAGTCLVSGNVIAGARLGAIRAMDHGALVGPDLAEAGTALPPRLAISGNLVA